MPAILAALGRPVNLLRQYQSSPAFLSTSFQLLLGRNSISALSIVPAALHFFSTGQGLLWSFQKVYSYWFAPLTVVPAVEGWTLNLELPLVHPCGRLVSFSGCPVHSQSCSTQENDSSIKFLQNSPDGCKHSLAVFSLQHLLCLPCQREVRCWVFSVDASAPCIPVQLHVQIWPQISYNLGARSTALSVAPRSRFFPTTISVSLPTLYPVAPTTPSASIRSFHSSETDRPSRTICSSQSADFPKSLRSIPTLPTSPASSTLGSRLHNYFETKFVGRVLPGRLDAVIHSQSSCKSISCRLFWMLRRFLGTCALPLTDFTTTRSPLIVRRGGNAERNTHSPDTHSTQQAKQTWHERTTMNPRRIQHLNPMQLRLI